MLPAMDYSSSYPEVDALLATLLSSVQRVLGRDFVAMYLYGSLAVGDFDPLHSDIDYVVVTAGELADATFAALRAMHARVAAADSKWVTEIEASYIPQAALLRYDPQNARHPHIDRGPGAQLNWEQHDCDWIIQRYVLHEHGIALAGPPPQNLIDPISSAELRRATLDLLSVWWVPMIDDPQRLYHNGYQAYAVLTMCRILYTLKYGAVVSKPVAARWVRETQEGAWGDLIARASDWDLRREDIGATQALITHVYAQAQKVCKNQNF